MPITKDHDHNLKKNPDQASHKNDFPEITVIIPVFNREDTVERAIRSVMNQTLSNWKLIVVDDCSTDLSWERAKSLSETDQRITVLKNTENMGSNPSRNRAIDQSTSEWLAFLDSDDEYHPEHLEECMKRVQYFQSCDHPFDPGIVYSQIRVQYLNGSNRIFLANRFRDIRRDLAKASFIRTSCILMRRDALNNVGNFFVGYRCGDEYDLLIRATNEGYLVANIPKVTVEVYIQESRLHVHGLHFFRIYRRHKKFFQRWLTKKELGERIDWSTNFSRARRNRFQPMFWYFIAWYHSRDWKMFLRSITAPVYPELRWLRKKVTGNHTEPNHTI